MDEGREVREAEAEAEAGPGAEAGAGFRGDENRTEMGSGRVEAPLFRFRFLGSLARPRRDLSRLRRVRPAPVRQAWTLVQHV